MTKKNSCNPRCKTTARKTLHQLQQPNEARERHRHQGGKQRTPSLRPRLEGDRRRVSRTKMSNPQRSSIQTKLSNRSQNLHQREHRRERERALPRGDLEFHLLRSFLLLCRLHNRPSLLSPPNYMGLRWRISQGLSMSDRELRIVRLRS